MNKNYQKIKDKLAFTSTQEGDILVTWRPSLGSLGGINIEDFQLGDDSNFAWLPNENYSLNEAVTSGGFWWLSTLIGVDTNTGNIPSEGSLSWNKINKLGSVIIPKWTTPGLVTERLTLFRENTTIYGLKDTVVLPYNSLIAPSLDLANWEIVGGGGGGGGVSLTDIPYLTQFAVSSDSPIGQYANYEGHKTFDQENGHANVSSITYITTLDGGATEVLHASLLLMKAWVDTFVVLPSTKFGVKPSATITGSGLFGSVGLVYRNI